MQRVLELFDFLISSFFVYLILMVLKIIKKNTLLHGDLFSMYKFKTFEFIFYLTAILIFFQTFKLKIN